jgi:hypothetical protein
MLLQLIPFVMVTICTEHTRSGLSKMKLFEQIQLLCLNPVLMVTTCTEHTRSRKLPLFEADPVMIG